MASSASVKRIETVALYARVSSEMQLENDLSIATQLDSLREFAHRNGWNIYHEEFVDEAQSARTAERPAFERMISLAKKKPKPFDAILVWKFSRFARNRQDSVVYKALLRRHGINVISITEPIDDSPAGELLEGIIEIIDEFYSKSLAQDSMRGLKEVASRGFSTGGAAPYGFKLVKAADGATERSKLDIDEKQAPIVREIFTRYLNGQGAKTIAADLNARGIKSPKGGGWWTSVILKLLGNEKYTGAMIYHDEHGRKIVCENAHPAIIDKETFRKVQVLRKQRAHTPAAVLGSTHLLSGLVKCGLCGGSMTSINGKGRKPKQYRCKAYHDQGTAVCKGIYVRADRLDNAVLNLIKKVVLEEDTIEHLADEINRALEESTAEKRSMIQALEEELKDLRARRTRLYEALETGKLKIGMLAPRLDELTKRIKDVQRARDTLREELAKHRHGAVTVERVRQLVNNLEDTLAHADVKEKRAMLSQLISKVIVHKHRAVVHLKVPYPEDSFFSNLDTNAGSTGGRTRSYGSMR